MLTTYLKRQTTLTTYYTSSAGPYLDEFTDWLAQCGFHDEVICQYLPGVSEFAAWVDATSAYLCWLSIIVYVKSGEKIRGILFMGKLLVPEERWWLYIMTNAATGHNVNGRNKG